MMFPTKFPQSSLLTGKWFLTMIQSNDPKIEGADACKSAFYEQVTGVKCFLFFSS